MMIGQSLLTLIDINFEHLYALLMFQHRNREVYTGLEPPLSKHEKSTLVGVQDRAPKDVLLVKWQSHAAIDPQEAGLC